MKTELKKDYNLDEYNNNSMKMGENFEKPRYIVDSIVVCNLKYNIVKKEGKNPFKQVETSKTILNEINLDFKMGQLNAILGPSGSGKTTLLNFLSMRVQENSKCFGIYLVNGTEAYQNKNYRNSIAYIQQDEILLCHLTVKETLTYAAKLRLPKQMTDREKELRVDELMIKLNLRHCENTLVGKVGIVKGISGGEKKRLSIGMELISNPSVLFVDEPTSGLDSVMSFEVIELLKNLSNEGVTVITTIHQPSSEIYRMFDNILLLKGGKILSYCGNVELIDLFNKNNLKMERFTNPADHILTVLFDRGEKYTQNFEKIIQNYHETQGKEVKEKIQKLGLEETQEIITSPTLLKKNKIKNSEGKNKKEKNLFKDSKPSSFYKFKVLLWRNFICSYRDPQSFSYMLSTSIFMGIFTGLMFLRIGSKSQRSIQDRRGAILMVIINLGFAGMENNLAIFYPHRAVFFKEYLSGMYGVIPYYFSIVIAELPLQLFNPLAFISIVYFMIGFVPNAGNFFMFFVVVLIINLSMNGAGYMISAISKDVQNALDIEGAIFFPLLFLSGFFINGDSIPKYLIWVQYLSPFKYGFEILMVEEFKGLVFTCKLSELVQSLCPYTSGQQVLASFFDFTVNSGLNWGLSIVLMLGYSFLAIVALYYKARKYKTTGKI